MSDLFDFAGLYIQFSPAGKYSYAYWDCSGVIKSGNNGVIFTIPSDNYQELIAGFAEEAIISTTNDEWKATSATRVIIKSAEMPFSNRYADFGIEIHAEMIETIKLDNIEIVPNFDSLNLLF